MKLRILLNLILLNSSFCCIAMETKPEQISLWEKLPRDIKKEMLLNYPWENINKQDVTQMAERISKNIRQYNAISKVNKEFYSYITESFNKFLDKLDLNDEDFKKLNQYILDSLNSVKPLPKDFNLLIKLLKKLNKLSPDVKKGIDYSLLTYSGIKNELERFQELIKSGADVNAYFHGLTPLMWAISNGNTDAARLLINNNSDINEKDISGKTILMIATVAGNAIVAKLLIDEGADLNAKDIDGETALDLAKSKGHKEIAQLIEEKLKEQSK